MKKNLFCTGKSRPMSVSAYIEEYSPKSFVVRGNTKNIKDVLRSFGGRWNPHLKNGPGWIFSKKHTERVEEFLEEGSTEEWLSDDDEEVLETPFKEEKKDLEPPQLVKRCGRQDSSVETLRGQIREDVRKSLTEEFENAYQERLDNLERKTSRWQYLRLAFMAVNLGLMYLLLTREK